MPFSHTSRTGKTYHLYTGPKRGGGTQHYLSTKPTGTPAERLPEGFEVYETVNGQVYLRRQQPKLIDDQELECLRRRLAQPRPGHRYRLEVRGDTITLHESSRGPGLAEVISPFLSPGRLADLEDRFAHYQPIMRFLLVNAERRLFAPERYCFRGSVDDWISIGAPEPLEKLAAKYLKHLGHDSLYELY